MAKIQIIVQNVVTGNSWTEDYDKPGIGDNGNTLQAEDWAFKLIEWFNDTCHLGEAHRRLLGTKIIGASTAHVWVKRTSGMSLLFNRSVVDVFFCGNCGITGKKYGIGKSAVKRDYKYRAKKYEECHGAPTQANES